MRLSIFSMFKGPCVYLGSICSYPVPHFSMGVPFSSRTSYIALESLAICEMSCQGFFPSFKFVLTLFIVVFCVCFLFKQYRIKLYFYVFKFRFIIFFPFMVIESRPYSRFYLYFQIFTRLYFL